jgi:hypothetical protein
MSVKKLISTLTLEQTAQALNTHISTVQALLANSHLELAPESTQDNLLIRVPSILGYIMNKKDEALKRAYDHNRQLARDFLYDCQNSASSAEELAGQLKVFHV